MKRFSAILLALLMLSAAAYAGQVPQADPSGHLTAGSPTPLRGDFFTELWGSNTADMDVRDLLHGYDLVTWNEENGLFALDPTVISGVSVSQNAAGDKTYTLVLYTDLAYSDGTKITAWDYAFSYLFTIAPEVGQIGGVPLRREQFAGYQEYTDGTVPYLSGVRVIADDILTVTLRHEYLPFFYELGLLSCRPYPIQVIAPGVAVRDDGNGVYLANADPEITEPLFTADLLRRTVLDPETGYRSHPSVVSGPYTLTSFDGKTAEFAVNPYFKGDEEGLRPRISTLSYTLADNDTMIDDLREGRFGLLNKVMRADAILDGLELVGEYPVSMQNYQRSGLSYIGFACEKATVSSQAVRQAIAWCMDRDAVTEDYTGGFGLRVDGYYGMGQWMYGIVEGTLDPPVTEPEEGSDAARRTEYAMKLQAFEQLSLDGLTQYQAQPETAAALLEQDGWMLNEDGIREKDGTVLSLLLIYPEGNNIARTLETNLAANLAQAGILLRLEAVPMNELLSQWYQQTERQADMIFMASNFDLIFDPAAHFQPSDEGAPCWSWTNLNDDELYSLALSMRRTEPGDVLSYMQRWVSFQERFNTVLPMLPVYSNIYFDFHTDRLQDYLITENATWGKAVVGAYLAEETPPEEPEAAE